MSDRQSWFKKRLAAAAWIAAVVSVALFLTAGCGIHQQKPQGQETGGSQTSEKPQEQETGGSRDGKEAVTGTGKDGTEGTPAASTGTLSLLEFCDDEELNAWFDSLEENTPVEMTYILMGEAPIAMEFTERDLILQTAEALKTVEIGGVSDENPENVADAGGTAVYFDMADGSSKGFSFTMGCFKWNGSEYHDVASYGDLTEVGETLRKIGNPQYVYVYSEDRGFYTQCLETYSTGWKGEDGCGGGLYIYLGEEEAAPYVEICRCADTDGDAEAFLKGELAQYLTAEIEESGAETAQAGPAEVYEVGKEELPAMLYVADLPEEAGGGSIEYLNVVLQDEDSLLGEPHLIRFCAVYGGEDAAQKEKTMEALNAAVRYFNLKHMAYEEKEVQPGNFLVDFINDDRIREWFDGLDDHAPELMLFMAKKTKDTQDPDEIRRVLDALQTVKIGDVSDERVGASGRRIYDFTYSDSGADQTFEFYENTFFWDGQSYDVLDWGELKKTGFW